MAVHGCHTAEIPVFPGTRFGVFETGLDHVGSMETGLKRNLGNARQVIAVHP
jgi:hypothetical protein